MFFRCYYDVDKKCNNYPDLLFTKSLLIKFIKKIIAFLSVV